MNVETKKKFGRFYWTTMQTFKNDCGRFSFEKNFNAKCFLYSIGSRSLTDVFSCILREHFSERGSSETSSGDSQNKQELSASHIDKLLYTDS